MPLEKLHKEGLGEMLFIFSRLTCICRRLPESFSGTYHLTLSREDTGLVEDVTPALQKKDGVWRIGEKELNDGSPFYFYTKEKEKLLLLLTQRPRQLHPAEKIHLKKGEDIRIGSEIGRAHV